MDIEVLETQFLHTTAFTQHCVLRLLVQLLVNAANVA